MGDPVTAAVILGGSGKALQIYGQYAGLKSAETQAKYEAQIDRTNAEIIEQRKRDLVATGGRAEAQIMTQTVQFAADQMTAFASGGIDVGSAVALETFDETARVGAADIIDLHHNIEQQVWGLDIDGLSLKASALLKESTAKSARRLATLGIISNLLSSGAAVVGGGAGGGGAGGGGASGGGGGGGLF